jgi:hypothetical protein
VELDQFLDQRETDARAFVGAGSRALDAMKALEQARPFGFRNPHPGVGDAQHHVRAFIAERHGNATLERELQRVRQQVEHHLFPHVAIDEERRGQWRAVDRVGQPGAFDR